MSVTTNDHIDGCDNQAVAVVVAEVRKLGSALGRHNGQEEGETTNQLFQRLSILLMKENATLFLNRVTEE